MGTPIGSGIVPRLAGELAVIVIGVLIALAADRWNQARAESALTEGYLERLEEEIRSDSVDIADFLSRLPAYRLAQDSLRGAVEGTVELPSTYNQILFRAAWGFRLSPIVAWGELTSTVSSTLIRDPSLRRDLSTYYASRRRAEEVLSQVEDDNRGAYLDLLYSIGAMDGSVEPGELASFISAPEATGLLNRLGGYHNTARFLLIELLEAASTALDALGARPDRDSA